MASSPNHRKSKRFVHESIVMLANENAEYFSYAKMFNFSGGGLYLESDVALQPRTKLQIRFDRPPFQSGPKVLSSLVIWCREVADYNSDYIYRIGVKFI